MGCRRPVGRPARPVVDSDSRGSVWRKARGLFHVSARNPARSGFSSATLRPALKEIRAELMALGDMRDKPAGKVRITTFLYAAMQVLWPVLPGFLATYPVLLSVVGSMPGSLKMSVVLFRSRSPDRWCSTTATRSCGQRWRGRAWPMCMRSPHKSTWPAAGWCGYCRTGCPPLRAATSTSPAVARRRQHCRR